MTTVIENGFPLIWVNQLARFETWNKHNYRPSNYIHKWWARRPGTVFRAILLGIFGNDSLQELYYRGARLNKVVYDPFMGAGTTIIEANRLGCKAIGVDINPIAWFIAKKALERVDISALDQAYMKLSSTVGSDIRRLYKTCCPICGRECDAKFYLWVKIAECPRCGTTIRLYNDHLIRSDLKGDTVVCPHCYSVFVTQHGARAKCPACGVEFDPRERFVKKGRFACPNCHKTARVRDIVRRRGAPLDQVISCVVLECPVHGLQLKQPDKYDLSLYEMVKNEFEQSRNELLIPTQSIPAGLKTDDLLRMGYRYWYQLFNERQLVSLSKLLKAILELEEPLTEFMLIAFSGSLEFNNMLCSYKGVDVRRPGAVRHIFSHHAFVHTLEPLENNLWGSEKDSGTFPHIYKYRVRRAKLYCGRPEERVIMDGKVVERKVIPGERIEGIISSSFQDLISGKANTLLLCQDSRLVELPPASVDAVVTDPPYFDNIQYSELSNFFYVWLRIALKDKYAEFKPELILTKDEIVKNPRAGKGSEFFQRGLTEVFKKCRSFLKDNGVLVFTFHHRDEEAWFTIFKSIIDSGYYVSATYPVYSEMAISVHIKGQEAVKYDTIVVCRKRDGRAPAPLNWSLLIETILEYVNEMVKVLGKGGIKLTLSDIKNLAYAKLLELYTKHYPHVRRNGDQVSFEATLRYLKDLIERGVISEEASQA
jgi:adenine-specific DNA methylase